MSDLESVIEGAVQTSGISESEPQVEADSIDSTPEAPVEAPEAPVSPEVPAEGVEVKPVDGAVPKAEDDLFSKKHGVPAREPSGRENRIPYSRVKKITENALKEANDGFTKERETLSQKAAAYEAQIKDYTERFERVADFERVMVNNKPEFLQWLVSNVPGYSEIFNKMLQPQAQAPAKDPSNGMPQPDQDLADGSRVYSLEGLQKLLDWQEQRVSNKVTQQVQQRYAPIETEWQAQRRLAELVPVIQGQIDEARKWPLFSENEADITKALQSDGRLSLEGAYRKVVFPKIQAERETMRGQILEEIKKAPVSTAAPIRPAKPVAASTGKPRTLEEIIADQVENLKR
jgi:hypothetical protein